MTITEKESLRGLEGHGAVSLNQDCESLCHAVTGFFREDGTKAYKTECGLSLHDEPSKPRVEFVKDGVEMCEECWPYHIIHSEELTRRREALRDQRDTSVDLDDLADKAQNCIRVYDAKITSTRTSDDRLSVMLDEETTRSGCEPPDDLLAVTARNHWALASVDVIWVEEYDDFVPYLIFRPFESLAVRDTHGNG